MININYGQSDALLLPRFDFNTFTGTPYLNFKWAYAKSDVNYSDELIVLVSNDCGVNWTQKFYRTGTAMTTGTTQTTPYVPDTNTVWKTANINLGTYSTNSNVLIKIVNVTDGGNNLYIDNINLGAIPTGIYENDDVDFMVNIFPNPVNSLATLQYTLTQSENISIGIYNTIGQRVYFTNQSEQPAGTHEVFIDVRKWSSSSLYWVKIKIGDKYISKKIIVNF